MAKKTPAKKGKPKSRKRRATGSASGVGSATGVGASTAEATGNAAGKAVSASTAFQSGAFQSGAFQGLPPSASQGKLSPAVQSTAGEVNPPHELKTEGITTAPPELGTPPLTVIAGAGDLSVNASVIPSPIPITPTVYPDSPQGTIIVQNHVTININGIDFGEFSSSMKELIGELRRSNEFSVEVRDQLISEFRAGTELIAAPKPQRHWIDLLLVKPLKWLAEKSGSAIIAKLALDALALLSKML